LETIDHIGASGVPVITVMNKIDLISEAEVQQKMRTLEEKATTLVPISALHKTNLEQLKQEILKILKNHVRATFTIPVTDKTMRFMAWLFENADVQKADYNENSVHVIFEAEPTFAEKVRSRVKTEFNRKVEKT
jgi:GTP-binding protein HflX